MRKKKKKHVVPLVILLLIVGLAAAAFLTTNRYLNKIVRVSDNVEIVAPENEDFETDEDTGLPALAPEEVTWGEETSISLEDE